MSKRSHNSGEQGKLPFEVRRRREAVANECIDALCRGETAEARKLARSQSADCPGLAEEIRSLRATVSGLSITPLSPDFSESVLDRVHAERGFLPRRARRRLSMSRVALACGVVLAASGIALYHRIFPQTPDPAPINMIAQALPSDAAATREAVAGTLGSLEERLSMSIASLLEQPAGDMYALTPSATGNAALSLGDTSRFDVTPKRPMTMDWRADSQTGMLALLPYRDPHRAQSARGVAGAWERGRMLELLTNGPTATTIVRKRPLFPLEEQWPVAATKVPEAKQSRESGDR